LGKLGAEALMTMLGTAPRADDASDGAGPIAAMDAAIRSAADARIVIRVIEDRRNARVRVGPYMVV
jgi:hypothetical protein